MSGYKFDELKLMVVDDDHHSRMLVVTILKAFGAVEIFEATNGNDAWAMLREVSPDVILLEWRMDGMTGPELVKMIRTAETSPNRFVPIIMLTGHTHVDHVREARDAGVNEFLVKPASARALMSRLVSVIEYPRAYVRTRSYFGPSRRSLAVDEYRGPERSTPEATERAKEPAAG